MNRVLVALAIALFALAGLAPLAAMLPRIELADLGAMVAARNLELLGRTLLYGGGVALIAVALGLPFGFLVARTDMPLANLLRPLGIVPLLIPPMILAMVWTVLADIRGAPAAYAVSAISTFPIVALFSARAFERIDARREEAARLAGGWRAALRSDLPLVLPSTACGACFAFVFTVNDYSIADYVSWLGQPKFSVYAAEIFANWRIDSKPGLAVATALPLIAITLAALIPALLLRRKGAMASLSGDFRQPARFELGAWRWPAFVFCLTLVSIGGLIPLARLFYEAGGAARGFELARVSRAFALAVERGREDLANSIVWSAAAATVCAALALVLGHALERSRIGRALEAFVVVPIGAPAVLLSVGVIVLWNHDWSARFYDEGGVVVLLLVGRFAAFAVLIATAATAALDPRLEEAARLAGAGSARTLTRIVAPLLRPALMGGWIGVFVLALRELDVTMLTPAANRTAMFRIFNQVHFGRDDFVAAMALLLVFLVLLPGMLWSLFARRRLELLP